MNNLLKEVEKRKRTIGGFAIFLVFMLFCTLISKGIYASKLTRVKTTVIQSIGIAHLVETEGTIKAGKNVAVSTIAGLRVENLYVNRGDEITPETALFQISQEDLKNKIAEQELSIKKLELTTQSMLENEALAQIKDQTQRQRAAEDYAISVDAAQEQINEAKKELEKAEEKLKEHKDKKVKVTSEEKRDKKESDYKNWQKKGSQLEQKVSEAESLLAEAENNLNNGNGTQDEVTAAKDALKKAKEALSAYQNESRDAPSFASEDAELEAWKSEKKALEEAVEAAQKKYDTALKEKEAAILAAQRALEDVQGNVTSDSTVETNQLDIAFQKEQLTAYKALQARSGMVYASTSGIVTGISVSPGERTPDGSSIVYADLSDSMQFEASLTKEQKKYVDLGDSFTVKIGNGDYLDLTVDYLMPDENDTENYQLIAKLPEGKGKVGQSGTMTAQRLSETYYCCIPIEALQSENERYYIYTVEEKETILGKELAARKMWVNVKDKNDKYAALEEGTLDAETKIIISSDKELKDGDIIRYQE